MEPTYFTCTLGEAASLGTQQPHKTINAFIDAQAKEHPEWPAVAFPQPGSHQDDPWTSLVFTFNDIKNGSEQTARRLMRSNEGLTKQQTVGLLCPSTPEFLFTWLALMRLGHAVLLIAPQCQPAAIASLCKACEVVMLFSDESYDELAQQAARVVAAEDHCQLTIAKLPFETFPDASAFVLVDNESTVLPSVSVSESDIAYLHHTSGTSSGTPKPIPQTHRAGVGVLPCFAQGYKSATFTTTPLYHGGIADLFRAWASSALIWLFPGKKVPITASNIVKCLDLAHKGHMDSALPPVKYFSSVPYVLQMTESDSRGRRYLQSMDIVGVGGAALPAEVGDRLVEEGVNLISRFGSAECGFLLSSHRDYDKDNEWQYLRPAPGVEQYLSFERQADDTGLSELVVLPGWPHMAKRNREDGSYATSDLFAPHENVPNAWRYHSRADSQLTLITGKKFDPAPLEASIATSELLEDVLIFGNGRPYPGALLFRGQQGAAMRDQEVLEQVWPAVDKLNSGSQDHARILKGMLIVMPILEVGLEKSSKGTFLRAAVEKRFQQQISNAYSQVDDSKAGPDVSDQDLPEVIRDMVQGVVRKGTVTETTDLFSYGVDSVAGMQIRSKLRKLLPADAKQLPINVVEDCGNVARLAGYIRSRRHGELETNGTAIEEEHKYMRELVEQYSQFRKSAYKGTITNGELPDGDDREVVVLTGATGALGAHVLDQYRSRSDVKKIYCLVRGADEHAAHERVDKALRQRTLRPLDTETGAQVVVLPARLGDVRLGLEEESYYSFATLAREATIIMHVAWSVNFRMKLRSFVKDNIAGVTNLLNLALASPRSPPPRFGFCSSVASVMAYDRDGSAVPEEIVDNPASATELGYSQSKWVAEQICQRANDCTRLKGRVSIYRVGQLAGDTVHGIWNTKEAWPMMLSAVKVTGSLPALKHEKLDWLPVDIAATALLQGVEAQQSPDSSGPAVYHVLNENSTPRWEDLLSWLKQSNSFDVVTPSEWVDQLEEAVVAKGSDHPAAQLLDHWKRAYKAEEVLEADGNSNADADGGRRKLQSPSFAMAHTKEALPALRSVAPLDEAYVGKLWRWVEDSM